MRQGYIDSQGNKYILTGVKAQFPRWTYAEWQAEGEPDIPWIRTDAPSGYRKVSGDDVSYDNTTSVNTKIDNVNSAKVNITDAKNWSGPVTLASFTGVEAVGYYNASLKLAYIKINGSSYTPTESGKQVSLSDGRFIPLAAEAFGFMRYGGYFWIDENYHLTFSSINTSQAWQNGYMLYPTRS